ncbi:MAG: hypothetical protein ABIP55_13915 [Tepidisphaeraceae bacterium]
MPAMRGYTDVILLLAIALSHIGCTPDAQTRTPATKPFVAPLRDIERSHGLSAWRRHRAVQCEFTLDIGEKRVIDGRLTAATDLSGSRLDLRDGTALVYDGTTAWVMPPRRDFDKARSHLLLWPYLLALPFTLRDAGSTLTSEGPLLLGGKHYDALRVSFAGSPADWHVLYPDGETGRLKAIAFMAAFDPIPRRGDEPHAVIYTDFTEIEGVPLAQHWMIYHWNRAQGTVGDPIARAALRNVRFVQPPPGFLDKPSAGAREDVMPVPK